MRSVSYGLLAIGVVMLMTAEIRAQEILACFHKQGSVRLVDDLSECKSSETALSLGGETSGLRVFDANESEIGLLVRNGIVIAAPGVTWQIYRENIGAVVTLQSLFPPTEFHLSGPAVNIALYAEPDCQGQAYMTTSLSTLSATGQVARLNLFGDPGPIFVIRAGSVPETIPLLSQLDPFQCLNRSFEDSVLPIDEISFAELGLSFPIQGPLFIAPRRN